MNNPFAQRGIHLLIDPDKWTDEELVKIIKQVRDPVRSLVVGGSYIHSGRLPEVVSICLSSNLPVGTFVGVGPVDSVLNARARFALVPILMGARSTQFITDHLFGLVEVADRLGVTLYSVGYLPLDGGGGATSCSFFTQQQPAPRDRPRMVALVGRVAASLGLHGLYLEAGSGARRPVTPAEVAAARAAFPRTIMVGGGLADGTTCTKLLEAGADALFIGTHLERTRDLASIIQSLEEIHICPTSAAS